MWESIGPFAVMAGLLMLWGLVVWKAGCGT